jgi:hypothetical protein
MSAFYADDKELFLPVCGFWDCLKIQSDLHRLVDWCGANSLELNVGVNHIFKDYVILLNSLTSWGV